MRRIGLLILAAVSTSVYSAPEQPVGWPAYGGDPGGSRYSSLTQITAKNVSDLTVAWTFRTGELGQGVKDWRRSAFEATPILYEGTLYLTTSSTDVIAVNAASGQLRWRHDSQSRKDLHYSDGVSRGVSLWVDEQSAQQAPCHARIFAPTLDGRLLALDAATGKPCADFGEQGAPAGAFVAAKLVSVGDVIEQTAIRHQLSAYYESSPHGHYC